MDPNVKLHLGKYQRYLWKDSGLLIVLGKFPQVIVSKQLYEERHKIAAPHENNQIVLHKLMSAIALTAFSLSQRESWGWTLTLPNSSVGFFIGIEPEGMICGKVNDADPKASRVYVQKKKLDGPLMQSHYEPVGNNPIKTIERYFHQVDQIKTRIELDDNNNGVLVQLMPGGNFDEVINLTSDKLIERCRQMAKQGELEPLDEIVMFYECRCDDKMILNMVQSLPKEHQKELWNENNELSIECPRCGREFILHK